MTKTKYEGIYIRTKKNGEKTYFARWKSANGQHNKKLGSNWGGMTLQDAVKLRARLILDENLGEFSPNYVKPTKITPTLDDCAKKYYESKSWDWQKTAYHKYIHRELGHIKIDELTHSDVFTWWVNLPNIRNPRTGKKFANKTINDRIDELKRIINYAIKTLELPIVNQASHSKIARLKLDNSRDRYLTKKEMDQVRNTINESGRKEKEELLLFFDLAVTTGGRINTITHIKVKDIDLERNVIKLTNFKNGNRTYNGFIHDSVRERLEAILESCEPEMYVLSKSFWPKDPSFFRGRLQPVFNFLFNTNNPDRKHRVVIHTLRHTFASHLALNGTPLYTIQQLMNHSDYHSTLRYSHLAPSTMINAVQSLDI